MIGSTILNYKIISLIGEGGMGNVYLGEHTSIGRKVAIKVLKPELASNIEVRKRFVNEAKVMAQLQHPGIISLYDYVEQEDGLYLIMEYFEGKELTEVLHSLSQPMPIDRAKKIMVGILEAFAYAHKAGIVHRDVKPSNILIDSDDNIKVLDFGIAKLIGDSQFNLTKTGTQIGTVYYMSPEQVKAKELDHRTDIYSLGVTFYELFSGFCPYKGLTSEFEVYSSIVEKELPDLTLSMGNGYKSVWEVIRKATAKAPRDRFQSCEEFKSALNAAAYSAGIVNENTQKVKDVQSNPVTAKKKNNTGVLVLIVLIFVIAGAGMIGYKLYLSDKDQSSASTTDAADEEKPNSKLDEAIPESQSELLLSEVSYQGASYRTENWTDDNGSNLVVFSETSDHIYITHFAKKNGVLRELRMINDFVKDCEFDLTLKVLQESIKILDLNQNGVKEIAFCYKLGCRSDVSPLEMKYILLENGEKYIIRGSETLYWDGELYEMGTTNIDKSLENGPSSFKNYLVKNWRIYQVTHL